MKLPPTPEPRERGIRGSPQGDGSGFKPEMTDITELE